MAVGQPETNLDTWGLRYVKKISGSKTPSTKPTESTSAGNRISDADVKTPDAIETRREGSESGTVRTTGATEGSDKKRQFAHGKEVPVGSKTGIEVDARSKLTARGDKKFTEAGGIHSGSEASNVSGIQSQTQQTVSEKNPHGVNRFGTPNKKNPEDRKARARGALPKAKAEMELAIIKCKLLKMNDISKKGEWDHLPHAQKEKEREEKEDEKVEKRNVDDEKYLDMATAVSGSGPAYVFAFMEAIVDAATSLGLPLDLAQTLTVETVLGSSLLARNNSQQLDQLREMVTSPGGTTAAALLKLEEGEFRSVIGKAVIAAHEKALSLGKDT